MSAKSTLGAMGGDQTDSKRVRVRAEQVRLLYRNINVGVLVTVVATTVLGRLEWGIVSHAAILGWCAYMFLVSLGRFSLGRSYWRASPAKQETGNWDRNFTIGSALAGAGWGAAGILLNPAGHLESQVFLAFIVGGMIMGGASLLAPTKEAFLIFMLPAGAAPALRFMLQGDRTHTAMGLLAGLFVIVTMITTRRIHQTIVSALMLKFENRDLVEHLQAAKSQAEALNEQLEGRVEERTAELQQTTDLLRAEIRQREEVEEELLRARKLESLGVLAGGIAHDFNNFLTVVQGNVEMAKMQLGRNEPVRHILERTAKACERAALLSSQLLTFSKGGAPVRKLVSMAKLITDSVDLARAGSKTRIELSIAEALRCVEVDPGQIGQVLHNILLNARQAMAESGIIEVRAENVVLAGAPGADTRVRATIRDYGCGIPFDVLPRIFDPYFTTKPDGRGLGLATAYAIIAKHGGSISAESKPGHGTVFTIDLRASQEVAIEPAPAAVEMHRGTARLLIMDDEDGLRELLRVVLTTLGYEVETAADGAEAIALCEHAKGLGRGFDAVLLDLTVTGGMGGVEAAAKLREVDPGLKLIVSSGYSDAPVMSEYRKYGFDGMIPKPWKIGHVSAVFERVLAEDRDRKATGG